MKKTKWFSAGVKPDLVGVYETKIHGRIAMQHWSGEFWGMRWERANTAAEFRKHRSIYQQVDWRGLAQDPNAK